MKVIFIINLLSLSIAQWMHEITLDSSNKFHLKWSFDHSKQQITFNVVVQTRGWIGFGISPNGGMTGSDLIIGWVDDNGLTHFHVCSISFNKLLFIQLISLKVFWKKLNF